MHLPGHMVARLTWQAAAIAVLAVGCARAPEPSLRMSQEDIARDLERVRSATAPFQDIAAAQAVGYPTATPPCLANPSAGGMGHHYINRKYIDDKLELERPEILLYAPDGDGRQSLVGVEYIIPYRILPATSKAPRILGQELKQSPELQLWYLHVWVWRENTSGLFADWNPAVKC